MFLLNNESKVSAKVEPLTPSGKPAIVDGAPVWSSADENVFTVTPAADGLTAVITSADTGTEVRSAALTVTADADLGDGVKPITYTETIVVGPAEASTLSGQFGNPEPK